MARKHFFVVIYIYKAGGEGKREIIAMGSVVQKS